MGNVDQYIRLREAVRAYAATPCFMLRARPVGDWVPSSAALPIAIFDTEEMARRYEADSLLPEQERGSIVDGKVRTYRAGSLFFHFQRGVFADGGTTEEQRIAAMVRPVPFDLDMERAPKNPRLPWWDPVAPPAPPAPEEDPPAAAELLAMCACAVEKVDLPLEVAEAWTLEQRQQVFGWADSAHAYGCWEDRVPMPEFLAPFRRPSPLLPLGWCQGDPCPPTAPWNDLLSHRLCIAAALSRASKAPPGPKANGCWSARPYSAEARELARKIMLEGTDLRGARATILCLFAADPVQPGPLHLAAADEGICDLIAWTMALAMDTLTNRRAIVAGAIRRVYTPPPGGPTVFPDTSDPWVRSLLDLHLRFCRGADPRILLQELDQLGPEPGGKRWELYRSAVDALREFSVAWVRALTPVGDSEDAS